MKNQKIIFALAVPAIIFITYLLVSRSNEKGLVGVESPNKIVMSTIARVMAVAPDEKTARQGIDAAFEKIYRVEKLMNRYDPNSQLSKVNKLAAKEPVKVDRELFDILQQSVYYSRLSDGAFDITVGPLVDLWRKCAEANSMPTDKQLAEVKKIIGCDKLLLNANDFSVRFAAEGMKLDLGGIAKGFAADIAAAEMKKAGAVGGLIDLGGQIGCFGTTEKKGKWIIGVRNPAKSEDNKILARLALSDAAVSTSGNYERFYKIGDKRFSHIFNPATEKSADQLSSVTIIASNGTEADALSTAVSVMGAEKGLELIEKTENTEAVIIKASGQDLIKSSGAQQYLIK
ncbi:MAG: FAD:protein FMN transferase [Sedimentisphaerales bacterium]